MGCVGSRFTIPPALIPSLMTQHIKSGSNFKFNVSRVSLDYFSPIIQAYDIDTDDTISLDFMHNTIHSTCYKVLQFITTVL